jgi:Na+/H+ antiporter NhaD/arsenite permease-like protein
MAIEPMKAITDKKLFIQSVTVFFLVIVGFLLHKVLGYEASLVALCGATVIMIFSKLDFQRIASEIEWETLFFFIGLFTLTRALEDVGVTGSLAQLLAGLQVPPLFIVLLILWISGMLSGIIGAVPITTVFIPIVHSLQGVIPHSVELWWALALGASLGGNTGLSGAAANMVAVGLVEKSFKEKVSYMRFFKEGIIVTLIGLSVSTAYLVIRWSML